MSLTRLLGKLYPVGVASLYVCSFLFLLPGTLRHLDRPWGRLPKTSLVRGITQFAIADFDGDRQPDLATIRVIRVSSRAAEYFLELQLSSGSRPAIGILGPAGGLQLSSRDINGDKFADLVVTSLFDGQFVLILINDGKGNFRQVESSNFPEVGKHPVSRMISPDDFAAYQLTLGQNRGTESDEGSRNRWYRSNENSVAFLPFTSLRPRCLLALTVPGRAPPLV